MGTPPPPPGQLKAALAAFGSDANMWDDLADTLDAAKTGAQGLNIDPRAFGPTVWLGVADKYNLVRQMVANRCGEGATEFRAIAANLITARNQYEQATNYDTQSIKQNLAGH